MTNQENGCIIDDNPFGEEQIIVHNADCWRVHGACAIKKLDEIERLMKVCKKTVKTDVIIMIIESS